MLNPGQFSKIHIPYDKVLLRLGHARGRTMLDERTASLIQEEISLCEKLAAPKQVIASSKIVISGNSTVNLEPGLIINSAKIVELLANCSTAYGFAVTAGPHIEEKIKRLIFEKETSKALILDAIGSVIAEELAEITNKQITAEAKLNGFNTTRRFSPGYGDWHISGQKDFLRWLGADNIGIKLNDNFQMTPEKSVSALLGLYKE